MYRRIYAKRGNRRYQLMLSTAQVKKYDNGAMVSCGLSIPEDMPESAFQWLFVHQRAMQVSETEYNHSGCQSRCVLRGDALCQW